MPRKWVSEEKVVWCDGEVELVSNGVFVTTYHVTKDHKRCPIGNHATTWLYKHKQCMLCSLADTKRMRAITKKNSRRYLSLHRLPQTKQPSMHQGHMEILRSVYEPRWHM